MRNLVLMTAVTGLLAGCNSIDNPFSNDAPSSVPGNVAAAAAGPGASGSNVVQGTPEQKRIGKRGGTQASVLVDGQPITTNMIKRRAAFLRLRRVGGNRTTKARNELIDEAIQMKEARRINAVASQAEVDAAYLRFASGNKIPPKQLDRIMAQSGVTKRGFKDYIKAQISWQRAVAARRGAEAAGTDGNPANRSKGPAWLPPVGQATTDVKQYTLQQIVFVAPRGDASKANARKGEANRFRTAFTGCDNSKAQAARLRNVSIVERGRVLASELPPEWRKLVEATSEGRATSARVTPKGVELIGVCRSQTIKAVAKPETLFADGKVNENASGFEKRYLAELKERAKIETR